MATEVVTDTEAERETNNESLKLLSDNSSSSSSPSALYCETVIRKALVLGSALSGKTALVTRYTQNRWSGEGRAVECCK